jgi:Peptidase family S41
MSLSKRAGLILSLLIATTCCTLGCGDKPERLDLSAEQWREDLKYLARTLPARHASAFHFTPKERFNAAVTDLDREIEHLNGDAVWTGMGKIVALVGDAHTYLQVPQDNASFPVDLAKFGNTYRVEAASQELSRLLGARVIKVGDSSVEHTAELLLQMLAQDENPPLSERFLEEGLTTGAKLHGLGIIPDRDTARYTLVGDDGKEFTAQVQARAASQSGNELIQASKEQPLSRQRKGESFWCTYLMSSKTVYCNVRLIRDLKKPGRQMLKLIEQNNTEKLVIDLRQNPGGDFHEGLKYLVHPVREIPSINKKGICLS